MLKTIGFPTLVWIYFIITKRTNGLADHDCEGYISAVNYHCHNSSQCVNRREHFCNEVEDCSDGSDDVEYNATRHRSLPGVACQSRYIYGKKLRNGPRKLDSEFNQEVIGSLKTCLLPERYVCDDELDCLNGADECGCPNAFKCGEEECALKQMFCDGRVDCVTSNIDEKSFNRSEIGGFQCPVTITHITNTCELDFDYVCDGFSDCDDGIDECFCDFSKGRGREAQVNSFSNDQCFRCLDELLVVPKRYVCDGILNCADGSDECLCPTVNETISGLCKSICPGDNCPVTCDQGQIYCIPNKFDKLDSANLCHDSSILCNNVYDCADHSDEDNCPMNEQTAICHDNTTLISKIYWCDHKNDCPDGSDEAYCNEYKHFCVFYSALFQGIPSGSDIRDPELRPLVTAQIPPIGYINQFGDEIVFNYDRPLYADGCDGVPTCEGFDDECTVKYDLCPNRTELPGFCKFVNKTYFTCPNTLSKIIGVEVCDGKPTCNITAPWDSVDELFCPNRFYCADKGRERLPIHVSPQERCNNLADCFDQSDELNCSTETHFYCEDEGDVSFVRRSQVCDGYADCKSGIDECQKCLKSPFSSDEWMIHNKFFTFLLWAMGLLATCGNVYVIFSTVRHIRENKGQLSSVACGNRYLVINLAFADLLVGVYLISLGIKDAEFRGRYCLMDEEWRSGATCTALGSIAMLGTETSVIILTIMTTYRLYLISRPFQTQKMSYIGMAIVIAWVCGAILAFVPLSPHLVEYFQSEIWYSSHAFLGKVNKIELQEFTSNIVKFSDKAQNLKKYINETGYTWENMIKINQILNDSYVPRRFYGYYAAHGVCLPRLFPKTSDDSYGFSLFIVAFNLFAFLYIMCAYVYIYFKTTRTRIQSSGQENRAQSLQSKVTRIIVTNFLCWIPICIMALITVSGIVVPDIAYVVSAIVLLPINSAFNPFLYTDLLDSLVNSIKVLRKSYLKPMKEHAMQSLSPHSTLSGANGTRKTKNTSLSTQKQHHSENPHRQRGGSSSVGLQVNDAFEANSV